MNEINVKLRNYMRCVTYFSSCDMDINSNKCLYWQNESRRSSRWNDIHFRNIMLLLNWTASRYKDCFGPVVMIRWRLASIGIPIIKITRSHHYAIFIMELTIHGNMVFLFHHGFRRMSNNGNDKTMISQIQNIKEKRDCNDSPFFLYYDRETILATIIKYDMTSSMKYCIHKD